MLYLVDAKPRPSKSFTMLSNLDRFKKDLESLIKTGDQLHNSIQAEAYPQQIKTIAKEKLGAKAEGFIAALPQFDTTYERWYSEAKALIAQLLPDRLADFVRHYETPKSRKNITYESYRLEDYLVGLEVRRGEGPAVAITHFRQQLAILKAVKTRFESSLFDVRQLVMADLFDSELAAATELAKKNFLRAAGVVAGVVLEKHLAQVCRNHSVKILKRSPTISDLNDLLKAKNVVDVPQWRFIQHLGDLRNLCGHNRQTEPNAEQVSDLITGVDRTVKTLF